MDWSIILAAAEASSTLSKALHVAWIVVLVLIGVNLLIIVHEWGHYIVARMCGVRCEKFYIWLDIFGWKLFRFRWGQTEFGLGVLPVGGYVKMLGQEDNPARLREELERAKADQAAPDGTPPDDQGGSQQGGQKIDVAAAEAALYDPHSYLSKSVPQRMAIISAGVVMNVIFAFVTAVLAYGNGVFEKQCGVGMVSPGGAAWHANLRPGDRIVEIAGKKATKFSQLQKRTKIGNIAHGVSMVIEREGVDHPIEVKLIPDRNLAVPTIGITNPSDITLYERFAVIPGSAADRARPAFKPGDRIVQVDDVPIRGYADYHRQEALKRDKTLSITVQRGGEPSTPGGPARGARRLTIRVAPNPIRDLGLAMEMGPITAVQPGSPAEQAGLKPGDRITAVDAQPVADPLRLPAILARRAAAAPDDQPPAVELTLAGRPLPVRVVLRRADWYGGPLFPTDHTPVPALGVVYEVTARVASVRPGSPAAGAGMKAGDTIKKVKLSAPDAKARRRLGIPDSAKQGSDTFEIGPKQLTWSSVFQALQDSLPGTKVELHLEDDRLVELKPVEAADWFNPNRGFAFQPKETFVRASTPGEAVRLGGQETVDSLLFVWGILSKLGSQISPRALGGPVAIVQMAYNSAAAGLSDLLLFLCLLSANLAVLNFLPIPVLDGGHMVFLAYEGIRGKPPSEGVQIGLSYLGMALLLGLMVWVFGLDLGLISRQ